MNLPDQPTTGTTHILPLGGDGVQAPISLQVVQMDVASDASGGSSNLSIASDPRYTSLIAWLTVTFTSSAAATVGRVTIQNSSAWQWSETRLNVNFATQARAIATFEPPPILLTNDSVFTGQLLSAWDNVDTETQELRVSILNFDRNLRQLAPHWLTLLNTSR